MKFRERDGRLQAAENLLKRKITNLVCGYCGMLGPAFSCVIMMLAGHETIETRRCCTCG
jgi:hypothetical protein